MFSCKIVKQYGCSYSSLSPIRVDVIDSAISLCFFCLIFNEILSFIYILLVSMRKLIAFLTTPYDDNSHFVKRKAEYSAIFMILIMIVIVSILGTELISYGFSRMKIWITMCFVFSFIFLFILLKKGFLEASLDLLILAGFSRCVMIMNSFPGIQFYSMVFLILLSTGVVHIKHYQLYFSYALSLVFFVIRLFMYTNPGNEMDSPFHQALYCLFLLLVYITMINFIVKLIEQEIRESAKLEFLAETDTLTGAGNRRKLHKTLSDFSLQRVHSGYSLLLLDLDHFKKINDNYGHDRGDQVLQELVKVIKSEIRDVDSLYRWGGEEFLVLIPSTDITDLMKAAERIREGVEAFVFPGHLKVTVSIGAVAGRADDELNVLIHRADEALYRAKESGRNRVCE